MNENKKLRKEKLSDDELMAKYDEYLDELYPEVTIERATLYPSEILKTCDPPAYQEGLDIFIADELNQED